MKSHKKERPFDDWPEAYDRWFTTPIGSFVKRYEADLLLDLLRPRHEELILDAGCGTGVFTQGFLSHGPHIVGFDLSLPMLMGARERLKGYPFRMVLGDILKLPFLQNSFDRVVSVTALEFIEDAESAVKELFLVTKKGGCVVVATLNSLSPWALRRKAEAEKKPSIFEKTVFRSPDELRSLVPLEGVARTAIHFHKEHDPDRAEEIEREGQRRSLNTGAFVAVRWEKP